MSVKWGRNYQLEVELANGNILQINYPLSLELNIVRKPYASTNTATFRVYNLSPDTRTQIYRDKFDTTDFRSLKLSAGYGQAPYPVVFNGNVQQAYSWRDSGRVDFITEIQGTDFGYTMVNAFSNVTLQGSQPKQAVVNNIITNLTNTVPSLGVGYISTFAGTYPRGRVLMGNSWQILQQETGQNCYIDNGLVYALKPNDTFNGSGITQIDSSTGLLSTPKRAETYLTIEVLFEPNIIIGQQIQLVSSQTQFNGLYKVMGIQHQGIISGAVNGRLTTILFLYYGSAKLNAITQAGLPKI